MSLQEEYSQERDRFLKEHSFSSDSAPALFAYYLHKRQIKKVHKLIEHFADKEQARTVTNGAIVEALKSLL